MVVLADGSENTLSDTDSYADDAEANAALYSAGDLTIGGSGALTVTGNGNDAIAGKDGLVVEGGNITVEAADDGIRGKDYLVVERRHGHRDGEGRRTQVRQRGRAGRGLHRRRRWHGLRHRER